LLLVAQAALGVVFVWFIPREVCRARVTSPQTAPIVCAGRHCSIDRRYLSRLMETPGTLGRQIRYTSYANGCHTYMLSGIRPGSAGARLGLRNGDHIVRVNGRAFVHPDDTLQQYLAAKHADHVSLDVMRNGQLARYDYDVR
jgi:type II secretory pathway component PulC